MSKTPTRIYAVHDAGLDTVHLVRAHNAATAVRFVASKQYTPEVATQEMLVGRLQAGATVLDATTEAEVQDAA